MAAPLVLQVHHPALHVLGAELSLPATIHAKGGRLGATVVAASRPFHVLGAELSLPATIHAKGGRLGATMVAAPFGVGDIDHPLPPVLSAELRFAMNTIHAKRGRFGCNPRRPHFLLAKSTIPSLLCSDQNSLFLVPFAPKESTLVQPWWPHLLPQKPTIRPLTIAIFRRRGAPAYFKHGYPR